ncbi:hypothetical protein [Paenibacillus alvei]|uniref:Uncharacterized protein n=1 Tax=Paenibacillus alvei TaxID=44250 RepID=A0A383RIR8_PAEAL|nr:hypothetical protein [Paenibacillus alvei]SYX86918.1 conserved protein of unknown function [Paenibacillus alvei]
MSMKNNWNVPYSSIVWFYNAMKAHTKVISVERELDILFTITDIEDRTYKALLLDEYRMGEAAVYKAIEEFGNFDFIVFGGNWNEATSEAYKVAKENNIALFNYSGIMGALNLTNPKRYKQIAKKKNTAKPREGA